MTFHLDWPARGSENAPSAAIVLPDREREGSPCLHRPVTRRRLGQRAGGLAILSIAAAIVGYALIERAGRPPQLPPRTPAEIAAPHLTKAERESERAIDEHLKILDEFFAASKQNTRGFAEDAMGWGSKRRLIQDSLPFTRSDRHREFLKGKFETQIFAPAQLEDAVRQTIKSYLAHVRGIESKMLVDLRADARDFPATLPIAQLDDRRLQESFDEALAKAIDATGDQVKVEIVTVVAGEVFAQVAIRLGVRAGILGAGAASGAFTFGIGIVVGLIVDQIVAMIWNWTVDPKGELAGEIDKKLSEMNRLLIDGTTDVKGLRDRLREIARQLRRRPPHGRHCSS